jgi:hypothetical protein
MRIARCLKINTPISTLICIKPREAFVSDSSRPFTSVACRAGNPLAEHFTLRFAVGTFDSWMRLREALRDARDRGLDFDSFNYLALERAFAGGTIVGPNQKLLVIEALPFSNDTELVACTSGPLADGLSERPSSGASSLIDALGHWLIPRHAAHFARAVRASKIVLWIRIAGADDERRAYQCLLINSFDVVGVHDLVLPGKR